MRCIKRILKVVGGRLLWRRVVTPIDRESAALTLSGNDNYVVPPILVVEPAGFRITPLTPPTQPEIRIEMARR